MTQVYDYSYAGKYETFTAPHDGNYLLEVMGAQGGDWETGSNLGARGGYSKGEIYLTKGDVLYIFVGGKGGTSTGGWNGGGNNYNGTAGGGGGGTDMRLNSTSLHDRVIVAGGGGGRSHTSSYSGAGGGLTGGNGTSGSGGTQTSGGSPNGGFGYGGNATGHHGSGGGGGHYGGGGGTSCSGSGGGGSGYVAGLINADTTINYRLGHGYARITTMLVPATDVPSMTVTSSIDSKVVMTGEKVTIEWEAATDPNEQATVTYAVDVSSTSRGWTTLIEGLTDLVYEYTIPELFSTDPSLRFRVRAYNDVGYSNGVLSDVLAVINHLFFLEIDGLYYTYDTALTEVIMPEYDRAVFIESGMYELNHIPASVWASLGDNINIVSYSNFDMEPVYDFSVDPYRPLEFFPEFQIHTSTSSSEEQVLELTAIPFNQLAIPTGDKRFPSSTLPESIEAITIRGSVQGEGEVRVLISPNQDAMYYSLEDGSWQPYTLDTESDYVGALALVQEKGLMMGDIEKITSAEWDLLFGDQPRFVKFIYALSVNASTCKAEAYEVDIKMNMRASWRRVKDTEMNYGYPDNTTLQVQLLTNGSYKINY